MTTSIATNEFRFNAVTSDGSALYAGYFPTSTPSTTNAGVSGTHTWANPRLTDFSALQAYSLYTAEVFLNSNPGNTTPDAVEYLRILSPVTSPISLLSLPINDLSPSAGLVTAPAPATSSMSVNWVNNPFAAAVENVQAYAEERSPKNAPPGPVNKWSGGVNVAAAYSVNSRPTSATITADTTCGGGTFPQLTAVAGGGDYREVTLRSWQGRARVYNTLGWGN